MSQECVKVVVRIRPLAQKQDNKKQQNFITCDTKQKNIMIKHNNYTRNKIFCFDDVFNQTITQQQIFQSTGNKLINQVLQGYNGTIFAYGQTGSGKTYTMMGQIIKNKQQQQQQQNLGIIPRCFKKIINQAYHYKNKNFLIMCSYIEIYNQNIKDLLNYQKQIKLDIKQTPDKGIFIKDLKKIPIRNQQQILNCYKLGNQHRSIGQTLMNQQSSRSHTIFTLYIQSRENNGVKQRLIGSKFNLIDLAGSERQNKTNSVGNRFVEATKINQSLSILGKVIGSLIDGKNGYIPYRECKLTRLLQDSLGGNTKTIMIANISSSISNIQQTISTLKYASRAKYIMNIPIINQDPKDALLREYEIQIKKLKNQLISKNQYIELSELKYQKEKIVEKSQLEKKKLLEKIKKLEQQFIINPQQIELNNQHKKRQKKWNFMQKNYKKLEQEVSQMRILLTELRRKYKNASKEIFQLQNDHENEKEIIEQQCKQLKQTNIIYKSVLTILFTQKQLKNIISLGYWDNSNSNINQKYKLPNFYFKDKSTLAFPCQNNQNKKQNLLKNQQKSNISTSLGLSTSQSKRCNQFRRRII